MEKFSASTQEILSDISRKPRIADSDIIRMIYIYYANYVDGGGPDKTLSFGEMRTIYESSQELILSFQGFCNFPRKTSSPDKEPQQDEIENEFRTQISIENQQLWDIICPVHYQLRMLGDIGATVMIISDIVKRTLSPGDFQGHFLGVDLGTGTGILLAAQKILAERSGFATQEFHGIELDHTVAKITSHFTEKLGYLIHQGDTTTHEGWNNIPHRQLTCITNENIPAANERMHREPFIKNMAWLFTNRPTDIHPTTVFFPEGLEICKDPITCEGDMRYVGTPQNGFAGREILKDAQIFEENGFGSLLRHLIPEKITLGNNTINLSSVSLMGAERVGNLGYRRGFMSRF